MARIRTFIAIELARPIREQLVALQESLGEAAPDVKWVEPENLHVTLLFLGEVEDREIPAVCRAVQEAAASHPTFAMTVERVGCFPNPRRPRILWAGIGSGLQDVVAIHDAIESPLLELGHYRREERKYTPHVTLGRNRSEGPAHALQQALAQEAGWTGGEQTVSEVLVMASDFGGQVKSGEVLSRGPKYTVLGRARLGGASR
jgi:2'-5' RNA ligase